MKKQFTLFVLLLISSIGLSQDPAKTQKRLKTWVYNINIIKDETGRIVKVEKTVSGKGSTKINMYLIKPGYRHRTAGSCPPPGHASVFCF